MNEEPRDPDQEANPYDAPRRPDDSDVATNLETASCPLPADVQRRNLMLFAACIAMIYFAAPVLYVGVTQSALCAKLGASVRVANLPATLFFAMTAMPALIAWLSPQIAVLRRNLAWCYAATAATLATTGLVVASSLPSSWKIGMLIVQGGVAGAAMPTATALLWEAVCRGADPALRGRALGLAFGVGPLFAVLGSLGQVLLIGGNFFGAEFTGAPFPTNFMWLFVAGVPVMIVATVLATRFVIPPPGIEIKRESPGKVLGLLIGLPAMMLAVALIQIAGAKSTVWMEYLAAFAGTIAVVALTYHFRAVFTRRVLFLITVVTILVYTGNTIPSNMNLYTQEALGDDPDKYVGVQNVLRFSFKTVAGLLLGVLLTRTNPRAGLLATSLIFLAAQLWAMFATGAAYLLAFGIYGAGELVGVYAPNYIVSASRPDELRKNAALFTMLMAPAAPAGYVFGLIVDKSKEYGWEAFGLSSSALGFRLSFAICALIILCGIILAWTTLPRWPNRDRET